MYCMQLHCQFKAFATTAEVLGLGLETVMNALAVFVLRPCVALKPVRCDVYKLYIDMFRRWVMVWGCQVLGQSSNTQSHDLWLLMKPLLCSNPTTQKSTAHMAGPGDIVHAAHGSSKPA